jgi:hypothetical protein
MLPPTPGGAADLKLMVQHILFVHKDANPYAAARGWAAARAPWCNDEEFDLMVDEIGPYPRFMTDRELGEFLEITDEVRERYGWRTIEAIDVTPRQRAAINREKDRKRKETQRRADGVAPREQYEANSLAKAEPWVPMGVSERTYFRRLKKARAAIVAAIEALGSAIAETGSGASETNLLSLPETHYCQIDNRSRRPDSMLTGSVPGVGNMSAGEAANDNVLVIAQADRGLAA